MAGRAKHTSPRRTDQDHSHAILGFATLAAYPRLELLNACLELVDGLLQGINQGIGWGHGVEEVGWG